MPVRNKRRVLSKEDGWIDRNRPVDRSSSASKPGSSSETTDSDEEFVDLQPHKTQTRRADRREKRRKKLEARELAMQAVAMKDLSNPSKTAKQRTADTVMPHTPVHRPGPAKESLSIPPCLQGLYCRHTTTAREETASEETECTPKAATCPPRN